LDLLALIIQLRMVINRVSAASQIKKIHVYDFDNTCKSVDCSGDSNLIKSVFLSPLPNPQLWNGPTIGFLQAYESFANGGWWHDPNILAATGEGIAEQEPRGWKDWWNDNIV
jgi:hypothetical protein